MVNFDKTLPKPRLLVVNASLANDRKATMAVWSHQFGAITTELATKPTHWKDYAS
ncbi:hypothetical protein LRP52_48505 [Photobacterium sp. ZSDE20]|nr:hypothetical protein [Photobacterium sp. ZSDE20]